MFKQSFFFQETQTNYALCDRINLIIQQKQAGKDTFKFDNGIVAIFDKLFEYKSFIPKQHKHILNKVNLLHTKKSKTS